MTNTLTIYWDTQDHGDLGWAWRLYRSGEVRDSGPLDAAEDASMDDLRREAQSIAPGAEVTIQTRGES